MWNVCVRASGEVLKEFNFKLKPGEKFWCLNEAENCGECVRWDKNIWLDLFSDLPTKSLPGRHSSSDWLDLCQNILHLTSDLHKFLQKPRFFSFLKNRFLKATHTISSVINVVEGMVDSEDDVCTGWGRLVMNEC